LGRSTFRRRPGDHSRRIVAEFLRFYPQYRLDDLRRMPPGEFYFLLTGMKDIEDPETTDPLDELIQKRLRAAMTRKR